MSTAKTPLLITLGPPCEAPAGTYAPYSTIIRTSLYVRSTAPATNVPHAMETNSAAPTAIRSMLVPRWLRSDPRSSGLAMVADRLSPLQHQAARELRRARYPASTSSSHLPMSGRYRRVSVDRRPRQAEPMTRFEKGRARCSPKPRKTGVVFRGGTAR